MELVIWTHPSGPLCLWQCFLCVPSQKWQIYKSSLGLDYVTQRRPSVILHRHWLTFQYFVIFGEEQLKTFRVGCITSPLLTLLSLITLLTTLLTPIFLLPGSLEGFSWFMFHTFHAFLLAYTIPQIRKTLPFIDVILIFLFFNEHRLIWNVNHFVFSHYNVTNSFKNGEIFQCRSSQNMSNIALSLSWMVLLNLIL